ncbi:YHS domain-containing protein [Murinocardiopsis flavida]|uniref:YHS domain-containing protein n=1 Tax=Murinocardiopsis flavida TaxID=645275 RepID=A0A2P8CLW5_9ACTN|nr:YHS domain-containing protein [Murinocardiopsis flavida]PSK85947.1 YHS domain-containing protein [Murinocardiopsis flavida]
MLFIELFVPRGARTRAELQDLAERLTAARLLDGAEGDTERADPGVMRLVESRTHVVVHEPAVWITDGRPADPAEPPCYVVNVHVGAWVKEVSEHIVAAVTREIAAAEGDPDGVYRQPRALVQVFGVPRGGYGILGRVQREADWTAEIEQAADPGREAPPGTFIDPVCGGIVPAESAVTLTRDGVTYGFCCPGCRGHFAKRLDERGEQGERAGVS